MSAFEEFGVMPEIIKAVEELEWTLPTDVQAEAIPLILGGGDVMAVRCGGALSIFFFSSCIFDCLNTSSSGCRNWLRQNWCK